MFSFLLVYFQIMGCFTWPASQVAPLRYRIVNTALGTRWQPWQGKYGKDLPIYPANNSLSNVL